MCKHCCSKSFRTIVFISVFIIIFLPVVTNFFRFRSIFYLIFRQLFTSWIYIFRRFYFCRERENFSIATDSDSLRLISPKIFWRCIGWKKLLLKKCTSITLCFIFNDFKDYIFYDVHIFKICFEFASYFSSKMSHVSRILSVRVPIFHNTKIRYF